VYSQLIDGFLSVFTIVPSDTIFQKSLQQKEGSVPIMLVVQQVQEDAADAIYALLTACGQHMKVHLGLLHWDPPCLIDDVRNYIRDAAVYAVIDTSSQQIVATFTVSHVSFVNYDESIWAIPAQRALYLSKLAVAPEHQGRGIGAWCMIQIESIARTQRCQAVRFDALLANTGLIRFYHCRLHYEIRDIITEPDSLEPGISWRLAVFEKVLE
jgi:GNAT superfamily N-acetyltransferase